MMQTNISFLEERRLFINVRSTGRILDWVDPKHVDSHELRAIRATLNMYEFVAIGIKKATMDGGLYKLSYRTTVVQDWIDLKPFVMEMRRVTKNPKFYCEYEALVHEWAKREERQRI